MQLAISLIFWILMLIALVFGGFGLYSADHRFFFGGGLLLFILLFLLGWGVFGFPVQGPGAPIR